MDSSRVPATPDIAPSATVRNPVLQPLATLPRWPPHTGLDNRERCHDPWCHSVCGRHRIGRDSGVFLFGVIFFAEFLVIFHMILFVVSCHIIGRFVVTFRVFFFAFSTCLSGHFRHNFSMVSLMVVFSYFLGANTLAFHGKICTAFFGHFLCHDFSGFFFHFL